MRGSQPKPRLPATRVIIESLNLKPKQKFLYLFDYGDEWQFEVEFLKEGPQRKHSTHASSIQEEKLQNSTQTMKKRNARTVESLYKKTNTKR